MYPPRGFAAWLLPSLLLAAGCQRAAEKPAPAPPAAIVTQAEWIDFAGLEQRLESERGRVVVVNFWATWCEPCREEFPHFVELYRRHRARGLTILAVSLDSGDARDTEVKKFLLEMRAPFPVFIKTPGDPDEFINAIDPQWSGSLPATLIYDRSGRRRQALFTPQTLASLEDLVEPLL